MDSDGHAGKSRSVRPVGRSVGRFKLPSPRPIFYRSESEMSPGAARTLRDRSPRLSVEMGRSRDSGSPSSPNAFHRVSFSNACPPTLASRRSGMSDGHMQRTYHEAMRQRRTSLPANSFSVKQPVSASSVSEARGLIADMLVNRDLPSNVATCLRAVASLLDQKPLPMHGLNDFGLPCVVEDPYSGEQLVVSGKSARGPWSMPSIPRSSSDHVGATAIAAQLPPSQPRTPGSRGSRDMSHRGSSARTSTSSMREMHLVGQCANCSLDFRCTCCYRCSHLSLVYLPLGDWMFRKLLDLYKGNVEFSVSAPSFVNLEASHAHILVRALSHFI
ncbi:unnamed protein product [Caenorhabditis auriculariae]|uniref:Uncharacterized protein n=1 Tax=Caenorhabditis auriculariae TaxID=2777116 RepID=A0A8S1HTM6_9PELO|nr:unnamed protein product [Caenorhabditis auriculariae]